MAGPIAINRKRLLNLMLLAVVAFILIYFNLWHENKSNQRSINGTNENLPINLQMKSVMNFPEWFRNEDWGLKRNASLENVEVEFRGMDKEEGTAWENFFYGTTQGLMLEVGAMNGQNYSVSAFFENKASWRTILIEGNPIMASKLQINRPNSLNFNYVICDKPRVVHYVATNIGLDGILEFMSKGFLRMAHSRYLGANGKLDMKKVEIGKNVIKVDCIPLTQILLSFEISHINFFILDLEGGEFNVLKTIDFDKITFDVIAVETDRFLDPPEITKKYVDAIAELLISKGYNLWKRKLGRNSWFVSPKFQPFKKM